MIVLLAGLVLFLGVHSVRIYADGWRTGVIGARGEKRWKGIFTLLSIAGFVLLVWGFGLARTEPVTLWDPPPTARWLTVVLTLPALILFVSAYVPRNAFKAWIGHPMMAGTALWAAAHLASNGSLADVLLFGAFLVWSVLGFRSARARDRAAGVGPAPATTAGTANALAAGVAFWGVFGSVLHAWLIGMRPLG